MIEFVEGDLFDDDSLDAIGHGVNCAGAMGKGIALEFRRRWPSMYEAYRKLCSRNGLRPGNVFVWDADGPVIFNLATQDHWRTKASLAAIYHSTVEMLRIAQHERQLERVGIPRIGAGLGGLPWSEVKETIEEAAKGFSITLVVFTLDGAKA